MAEIFLSYNLSLDELINAYLSEAFGVSKIIDSPRFSGLLEQHIDYDAYLSINRNSNASRDFSSYLRKKGGIIYTNDKNPFFMNALHSSHLSACCELFNGHSYTKQQLETSNFSYIIKNWLSTYKNNEAMLAKLGSPLHTLDAVRTIQILRTLSLVTIRTPNIQQISIGAGPANKDITSIHSLPKITYSNAKNTDDSELLFEMVPVKAGNIIVSDNDPQRKILYNKLSNTDNSNVIALNIDTYEALEESSTLVKNDKIEPINFIVALRIDHRMLPDIQLFFKLISKCMDQSADLIITMGSGHNIDDFKGRVNKLNEIFDFLFKLKLKPSLIKLHGEGSLEQQRSSCGFSTSSITTFQILHCKLKKKILQKTVRAH